MRLPVQEVRIRPLMKRLLLAAAVSLAALAGCKNPCLELAQKLCECESTATLRDSCSQRATDEANRNAVSPDQEANCRELMAPSDGGRPCDCHMLDSPEGKLACGLARDPGP